MKIEEKQKKNYYSRKKLCHAHETRRGKGRRAVYRKPTHTGPDASPLIATTQRRSNVELFEGLLTEQSRFAVTKN